ncbi:hypothetical protein C0J52_16688 [Blattella germanica]|nr:hypothetical protein C0J52_16688 [Blattella germanica]
MMLQNITSFKSSDVINHFEEALSKVTVEKWKNVYEHVRKEEDFYWERDGMIDEAIDNFVIILEYSDSDNDNDEEDTTSNMMEGVSVLSPSP